ncbi:MAG TPA: DNA polymerase III subunit alpha [Bacteroidales bacterium]|nr:DNA polymerase III subunit alpha [Bacteroidales bacterium]
MVNFTHLHVHTQYSVLDGASDITKLITKAKELGMTSLAITDHGNMFGVKEFFNKATSIGIKPILGCETYVAAKGRTDKSDTDDRSGFHLILLAKNETGYKNLCRLVSLAWLEGFYYKPRIDWELLSLYHEGLIASSACIAGEIPYYILKNDIEKAEQKIQDFKNLFGEDFYLELMRHKTDIPEIDEDVFAQQQIVNKELIRLSTKYDVKLIASNDVHFINVQDAEAHDHLLCINTGKLLTDTNRLKYTRMEYLKSPDEMMDLFADIPEAIENTNLIAEKIESFNLNKKPILPDFPLPEGFSDAYEYLEYLTYDGAKKRYPEITEVLKERIEFELAVIKKMNFPGYFLIVNDFIKAARDMGVSVGPGRGSAAGSVVAYCLFITDIEPMKYGLLFERFLNPDRVSMPDMDIDFDEDGREKVINWVVNKYGSSRVAQIITFGTMASKMAIRDVARVENLPLSEADKLAKLVPPKVKNLEEAIVASNELKQAKQSANPLIARTIKYAVDLEGSIRHTGIHACGIIIGKDDLIEHIPLCTSKDSDLTVTQYEGSHVESVGLLKMDFLGLKTLSIIKDALENIKFSKGIDIDLNNIPLDDKASYELFSNGNTTAIFQFESDGMKKHLRELKPNHFEDLIAMNALYRPGPMDNIPNYVRRKHGKEQITYDHPLMEESLKDTYGIPVYQEQVMELSRRMGNFSRGQADGLRKAMGKKNIVLMNELHPKFIEGCATNGISETIVNKVWKDWLAFAEYAFNKSHAACYAITAYRMAYLKAHFQNEFMAAVLSRNVSDIDEITFLIDECKKLNIRVLGPDINESQIRFVVNTKGEIRFGLAAIKGLGNAAVDVIISEREKNGTYKNIFDFLNRVNLRTVNKKSIEALAMAGAFDSMDIHRAQFFYKLPNEDITFLEKIIRHIALTQNKQNSMQQSLFGESSETEIPDPELPVCEPWSTIEMLNHEKEVIGFYMSGHPLDNFRIEIRHFTNFTLDKCENLSLFAGRDIRFAGMIIQAEHKINKNNKPFGYFKLEDYSGATRLNLWSENYDKFKHLLEIGKCIFVSGKVDRRGWGDKEKDPNYVIEYEIKIHSIEPLYSLLEKRTKELTLFINLEMVNTEYIERIKQLLKDYPGNVQLKMQVVDEEENITVDMLSRKRKISCEGFLKEIETINGIKYKLN